MKKKRLAIVLMFLLSCVGGHHATQACSLTPTLYLFSPTALTKWSNIIYSTVSVVNTTGIIWDATITAGESVAKIVPGYASGTDSGVIYIETAHTETSTAISLKVTARTTIAGSPVTNAMTKAGPTTAQTNYWPAEQQVEFYAGVLTDPVAAFVTTGGPPR